MHVQYNKTRIKRVFKVYSLRPYQLWK